MNAPVMRSFSIGILLLVLALLPIPGPMANPAMGSLHLGVLAYIQGGDVWVKALPDGQAKRLTADGRNWNPRWSPSGEWLAVGKGKSPYQLDQVSVLRANGREAHALHGGGPVARFAWAPTVDRLGYVVGPRVAGTGELWTVNGDGSDPKPLVTQAGVGAIAWSPDGAWIVYEGTRWALWGLSKVSSDGDVQRKISSWGGLEVEEREELCKSGVRVSHCADDATRPGPPELAGWMALGSYLLFWQGEAVSPAILHGPLYVLPASGGEARELIEDMLMYPDFLAGSPVKKLVAITEGGHRETWCNKRIVVMNLSSGQRTDLTDNTVAAFSPAWSPDGQWIAYVAGPDIGCFPGMEESKTGAARRRIWVMKGDSSSKRPLTKDAFYRDERPRWSVDGRHLLFVRLDQSDRASLCLIGADGSALTPVAYDLSPLPEGHGLGPWFGYYGHIHWDAYFDWWQETALVTRVIDGTTIEAEYRGRREKVRYLGITPLAIHPPEKGVEVLGRELKQASRALVQGKRVRLAFNAQPRDRHGRLRAHVYLPDGTFVNAWLVEHGYALVAPLHSNVKYQEVLLQLQREARKARRGLWGK